MSTSHVRLAAEWKREMNEPSDTRAAIEELRALVRGETLLKSRMDDAFMLKFLRARKYCVNKAFILVQNYYEARKKNSALFHLAGPSKYRRLLESGTVFMLPKRDQRGREIYVFRMEKISPGINVEDVFKVNLMILEVISENAETQLAGVVAVADFTGFEWRKHYQYLSPYYAKKSADVVQVHFHGNRFGSLHKHVSPNVLPKCFGGTLEYDPITWVQQFLNKERYFQEMAQYGYNK